MGNGVESDQTAPPEEEVRSGSTLFAETFLSENLGSTVLECLNM